MLRFDVITLFEPMFDAVSRHGITGRAFDRGLCSLVFWNPRDDATDAYRRIDDRPFGGGPGMVMMVEPLSATIRRMKAARAAAGVPPGPVICLSPQGARADHQRVRRLTEGGGAALLCGRYEGIDQRVLDTLVDGEVSIGDLVVSGGELPAMMLIDAAIRLVPGVLNDDASAEQDSFVDGLLDCPHYTRPEVFEGRAVPPVLLSGHHARIAAWRREQALLATARRRPDLIEAARRAGRLSRGDEKVLAAAATDGPAPPQGARAPGDGKG
ncbi:MAG TPA: tRNA (guanosine(37)-N1)-methyltransferase TrmD [Burkholderiaceae bacterium]|nr:tRNA (guanosine(37)-N1)-methyltransferase TrmD [Burkholderiaceae bacterium]